MEDQAQLAALDGKITQTAKLKEMRNAEKTAKIFHRIKVIQGVASNKGFTSIEVVPAD
jgi:hypothetical protein